MLEGVSATTIAAGCILARIASTIGFLPIFGQRRIPPQIAAILVLALVFSIIAANPALLEMELDDQSSLQIPIEISKCSL